MGWRQRQCGIRPARVTRERCSGWFGRFGRDGRSPAPPSGVTHAGPASAPRGDDHRHRSRSRRQLARPAVPRPVDRRSRPGRPGPRGGSVARATGGSRVRRRRALGCRDRLQGPLHRRHGDRDPVSGALGGGEPVPDLAHTLDRGRRRVARSIAGLGPFATGGTAPLRGRSRSRRRGLGAAPRRRRADVPPRRAPDLRRGPRRVRLAPRHPSGARRRERPRARDDRVVGRGERPARPGLRGRDARGRGRPTRRAPHPLVPRRRNACRRRTAGRRCGAGRGALPGHDRSAVGAALRTGRGRRRGGRRLRRGARPGPPNGGHRMVVTEWWSPSATRR